MKPDTSPDVGMCFGVSVGVDDMDDEVLELSRNPWGVEKVCRCECSE